MGFVLGVVGTAQQLETENASGGSSPSFQGTAPNPTNVRIAAASSGNPLADFAMAAQEISNAQNAPNPDGADQFDVTPFDFTNGQADITIDISTGGIGDLNAAYSGRSASAIIAFLGYIGATNATSFQWSLSVSSSLSAGSTSTSGLAGTNQNSLTYDPSIGSTQRGIEKSCRILWGGGRGGFIYPSNGDTVTCTIGADATNSNGTTSADDLVIEYTFST
tara:strand:- start:26 stop:685 length:660 start_codon:yes stop_codon:yes gene_type:complete